MRYIREIRAVHEYWNENSYTLIKLLHAWCAHLLVMRCTSTTGVIRPDLPGQTAYPPRFAIYNLAKLPIRLDSLGPDFGLKKHPIRLN